MSSLSAAEAWALAAKVSAVEAMRSGPQESAELREHAAALLAHARKLDESADLVVRAQGYLESPVKPAKHYAAEARPEPPRPEMYRYVCSLCGSGAVHRTKLATYGTCRDCGQGHMRRVGAGPKPSRRRGTKPASLPQTLAAACHTLKEP